MICEKLEGTLDSVEISYQSVEYVEIEWHEAFKKIHRKQTDTGREIGIRMGDWVLSRGIFEGDVIYMDDNLVIAVRTPKCQVIHIEVEPDHEYMDAKVCYEIGNRHAPLFFGESVHCFITPYNEPMFFMLSRLHGVKAEKRIEQIDFSRKISEVVHEHHH